jgi:uncharacterized protein
MEDPRRNIVEDEERVAEIVRTAKRVAVLGIKPETHRDRPAFYVLGKPVQRDLAQAGPSIDIVDVFRRPRDIPPHVADLKRLRPRCVWFQLGIRNDDAAMELAREGILVVQDRCLMVDWRRFRGR